MKNICKGCKNEIKDDEEYAVVWEKGSKKKLFISFYHIKCIPDEAEDITNELKGPREVITDENEEGNPTEVLPDQL